jgi:ABC-type branched-subunit amino acid transport system substrate-binding protein
VVLLVNASQPACVASVSAFEKHWRTEIKRPAVLSQFDKDSELPALAELADKQPKWAVVFAGSASEFTQFRTLLKAPRDRLLLFAGEPAELARLGESGSGVHAATVYNPALFVDAGKKFVKKYRETTRRDPDFFALSAWEMTQVLVEALRATRGAPAGRLREELARERSWTGLHEFKFEKGRARRSLFIFRLGDSASMKEFGPD